MLPAAGMEGDVVGFVEGERDGEEGPRVGDAGVAPRAPEGSVVVLLAPPPPLLLPRDMADALAAAAAAAAPAAPTAATREELGVTGG